MKTLRNLLIIGLLFITMNGLAQTQPPVYVVLFTHIEDNLPVGKLGTQESRQSYLIVRNKLIAVADLFRNYCARWVFEPDWKFLRAALIYEDSSLIATTNGKNFLRYLKEDLQVAIDPHSHEKGGYNYTDVAHLLDSLGVGGSTVIGGHIWDPDNPNFAQWDRFRVPVAGLQYPWALWRGDILMGSGTPNHVNDPHLSGVWRPKDRYHYFEDDPGGNIVVVGQYKDREIGDYNAIVASIQELLNLYDRGIVLPQYMLTVTVHLRPKEIFVPDGLQIIENSVLKPLVALQSQGKATLTDFTSLVNTWRTLFGARSYIYDPDNKYVRSAIGTFIPSEVGGTAGLYCEISLPDIPRYSAGAPVVVHVRGGWNAGGLDVARGDGPLSGFIKLRFNFPGGGTGAQKSGGNFDERGETCIRTLRDIVLFAMGKKTDRNGKYLGDLTAGITPLYNNVGLCGWSNGGNATITAAGAFAHDLAGLAWIVNWESPVGDGMPNVEAGSKKRLNPAYNPNTGSWDFSHLAFSDTLTVSAKTPGVKGSFYFDLNSNGIFDAADFKPVAYVFESGATKTYYSVGLRTEAENRGLVPAFAPATLATVEETQAFWLYRNGENWTDKVITENPQLMFMVTASQEDHVQGALDHPHVLIQYEAFRTAGTRFVRLNPDRVYVEAAGASSYPLAPDNPAFTAYDHLSIRNALEPEGANKIPDAIFCTAGIMELADRTQVNNLSTQLDSVILCK